MNPGIKYLILFQLFLINVYCLQGKPGIDRYICEDNKRLPEDTLKVRGNVVFPGEKWEVTTPESQGLSSSKLKEAIQLLEDNSGHDGVKEVMIIRNGYLIWEGEDVDKVHGVWSVTKSFTSTALGLLISDGKASLNTPVSDIVPEMRENYPDLTLRHFTTMTSGYRAQGDEARGNYTHGPSATPFIPGAPLFRPPGSKYAYWDSAMNQFAFILTLIAEEPLEDLLKNRVLDPIGINPKQW
ncbi:serine hydrolase domain-containing protein [Cyclobacterium plantarum]|uniref:serine hydrolase domain-containing protein n=1 Tax=Cyclobacterium plantarum TaxID=2716263 RepID=UPI003F6EE603